MKKTIAFLMVSVLLLSLTACGNSTPAAKLGGGEFFGIVTAVDGNSVTVSALSQPQMKGDFSAEPPEGEQGSMPEMPQGGFPGEKTGGEQGTPPEPPDGEQGSMPEMPQGGFPGEKPSDGHLTSGESKTFQITDSSILFKRENDTEVQATLAEITVGVTLRIAFDEDSHPTKILIESAGSLGGKDVPQSESDS